MNNLHSALIVLVVSAVTIFLRFFPFVVFTRKSETPPYIDYLGKVLPYSIIAMLVVYCLKSVSLLEKPYGIPEGISCVIVAILHIWKRNTLLSIIGGTAVYMILINYLMV